MLFPVNDYVLYIIKTETTRKFMREVAIDHLCGEINPRRPNWLSQQMHKALHSLGHLLVSLGQRLDRMEARPV